MPSIKKYEQLSKDEPMTDYWLMNGKIPPPKIELEDILQVLMDTARTPERMSEKGLNEMASMIPSPTPTGNLPLDLIKGTPSILAQSGLQSLSKVAPSFISPEAAATYGASKMIPAGALGKFSKAALTGSRRSPLPYSQAVALSSALNQPGLQALGISPREFESAAKGGAGLISKMASYGGTPQGASVIGAILDKLRQAKNKISPPEDDYVRPSEYMK